MKKLTPEQKKIIYLTAGVFIFLFILLFFIYLPSKRQVSSIKKQLSLAREEIAQINKLVGEKELAQVIKDLKTQADSLRSRLPFRDETIIANLTQKARSLNLEIKNIAISDRQPLEQKVSGTALEKLFLSLDLSGEYKALGEYLNCLRNDFPAAVTVDKLKISSGGEGKSILEINLGLWAYLAK